MKDINYFYNIAKREKITVYKEKLGNLNGLCYGDKENCSIYMNEDIIDQNVERLILAHELGHYFKGISANDIFCGACQERLKREINEFRATKWLINELIPYNLLIQYLMANKNEFDISKELNVPTQLVIDACLIYEEKLQKII